VGEGLGLALGGVEGGREMFAESTQRLINDEGRPMQDRAHQQPSGPLIQEELSLVGAADSTADLNADLGIGLAKTMHDARDQHPVMAPTLGGIHIHQAQAIAAAVQQGLCDFQRLRGYSLSLGAWCQAPVLDLEGRQNLQGRTFP